MVTFVKIIGVLLILAAVVYLSKPEFMRRVLQFFKHGSRIHFQTLVRFVLAVIFLLAAGQCHHPRVVAAFGIIFLISGLLMIIVGAQKVITALEWILKQPALIFRIIALVILAAGAVILYAA
jgi:drug/metabolite transporter superfamily protein YnfA